MRQQNDQKTKDKQQSTTTLHTKVKYQATRASP